jgi:Peptidase A4 family
MYHRTTGRRRPATIYWLLALVAAVSVIVVGFRLTRPGPSHLATSGYVMGHGGWGRGGYTMMPGPGDIEGPAFTNAAAAISGNWAGYAVTGQQGSFTSVSAAWTQPAASCSGTEEFAAFWVGLDGDGTQTVEQTGTEADCDGGTTSYQGWYEVFPAAPVFYSSPVQPGDAMSASVVSDGNDVFTLTLSDKTADWTQTIQQSSPDAELGSAEIIAEAPSDGESVLPLADFGTVDFTSATVNQQPLSSAPDLDAITMASNAGTLATPSTLSDDDAFSVTWDGSGAAEAAGSGGQGSGSGGQGNGQGGSGQGGWGGWTWGQSGW